MRLGRREDEDDARWRLLENLEQCVPRLARQHVRFIDDVDLETIFSRRRVHCALTELAGVIDAAIRGCINFDDVETGGAAPDTLAGNALSTGLAILPLVLAVQRHRENAGERRLADTAGSAKEVAVRDPASGDGAAQRVGHVRLDGYVSEGLWSVFAGECERHCEAGVPQVLRSNDRHRMPLLPSGS